MSQNQDFLWAKECETAFDSFKRLVANVTEVNHFNIHWETRFVCDASHNGQSVMLEQHSQEG